MIHRGSSIISTSTESTQQLAAELAREVHGGDIFALHGDLGFGKTTFTQGFAKALGIAQHLTSPTFLIVKEYTVKDHPQISHFYHVDLYRLTDQNELKDLGLEEMLRDPHAVTFIEWPGKMGDSLPASVNHITFRFIDETTREITIS